MSYARVSSLSAIPVSAAVTFGLFLIMTLLVAGDGTVTIEEHQIDPIVVYHELTVSPPQRTPRDVPKPPEPLPQPPVPVPVTEHPTPNPHGLPIPTPDIPTSQGPTSWNIVSDGEYLPLVRVQPTYPRRAMEQGKEGYVIVELTVGADGSVPADSVKVLEAEPKGLFDRAAIKAAQKFKYKPKVVNGIGQPVTGVTYRFSFNLAD